MLEDQKGYYLIGYVPDSSTFNAQLDRTSQLPQLESQVRLFCDGRQVYAGKVWPFKVRESDDMKRLLLVGELNVSRGVQPGEYVLQIVVTDKLAKEKRQIATQWIDFEVVG